MHTPDPKKLTDERFPERAGILSTHYDGCWKSHPECAYYLGVVDAVKFADSHPPVRTAAKTGLLG